jgi:hypothetical protein
MSITPLPTAPSRSDPSDVFVERADAWVASLSPWTTEANALAVDVAASDATSTAAASTASTASVEAAASAVTALNAPGTSATSSTAVLIGLGSKSFTIQTGKDLVIGMIMVASDDAAPTSNLMVGGITSYNSGSGALVLDISTVVGSGTKSAWTISITGQPGLDGGSNIVLDTSPELGGSLVVDGFSVGKAKGTDMTSSNPLIAVTDGDWAFVHGTTGFSSLTIAANRKIVCSFNSSGLVITEGSGIVLNNAGLNYTVVSGDLIEFQSIAANSVFGTIISRTGKAINTEIKDDLTPELGGGLITTGHYSGTARGGDFASSNPLNITPLGDFFFVAGTVGFSSMTLQINRRVRLVFYASLLITVGSGITLNNGGENFQTSPGDTIDFQSIEDDVVVGTILKSDGTPTNPSILQNARSSAYITLITDNGKHLYHPSSDTTARSFTLPANSVVAYPLGAAITFVNDVGAGVLTIELVADTLVWADNGAIGSRFMVGPGVATAIKVGTTRWIISGAGLS